MIVGYFHLFGIGSRPDHEGKLPSLQPAVKRILYAVRIYDERGGPAKALGNSIRSLRAMAAASQPWSGLSILILSVRPIYGGAMC